MSTLSIAAYFPFRRVRITGQSVGAQADVAMIDVVPDIVVLTFVLRPIPGGARGAGRIQPGAADLAFAHVCLRPFGASQLRPRHWANSPEMGEGPCFRARRQLRRLGTRRVIWKGPGWVEWA